MVKPQGRSNHAGLSHPASAALCRLHLPLRSEDMQKPNRQEAIGEENPPGKQPSSEWGCQPSTPTGGSDEVLFRQLHGLLPDINGIQLDHIREDTLTVPSTHSLRVPRAVACKLLEPQKIDCFSGKKWERDKCGTVHGTSCGQL